MTSRKRSAGELALPEHGSKHPRLVTRVNDCKAPSPEEEKLLNRWTHIGKEFLSLVSDTAAAVLPGISVWQPQPMEPSMSENEPSSSSVASSSPVSTPRQTPTPQSNPRIAVVHDSSTPKQSIPINIHSPTHSNFLENLDDEPTLDGMLYSTPKISTNKVNMASDSNSSLYSSPELKLNKEIVNNLTSLQLDSESSSRQSSQTSNSNSSLVESTLGTDVSMTSTSLGSRRHGRRNPRVREHIYAKVHKARVKREKELLRDEIVQEIYKTRRQSGYTSSRKDLEGLLDYERHLHDLDLDKVPERPAPSTSLGLRVSTREPLSEAAFLQRALANAKATLNSPKPAKPFAPSLDNLQLSRRLKDEEISGRLKAPSLPSSLPPEDEQQVNKIFQKRGLVSKFAREQVNDADISRLRPGQWLNDEIINFYGALILARSEGAKENTSKSKKKPLDIHYFSSFFWTKLTQDGYEKGRLAKWTKKIDIFSKDAILFPVNHGNAHWTAASINFHQKRFESFDSMGMAKERVFKVLRHYVNEEHMNKLKKPFNFDGWENYAPDDTPQQENGYDCGVFTCQFMSALSLGEPFNFSQKDMPYLRKRMVWEIGNAKLRDRP